MATKLFLLLISCYSVLSLLQAPSLYVPSSDYDCWDDCGKKVVIAQNAVEIHAANKGVLNGQVVTDEIDVMDITFARNMIVGMIVAEKVDCVCIVLDQ